MKELQNLVKQKFYLHHATKQKNIHFSIKENWIENEAFIEILPRQSGKSFLIKELYQEFKSKGQCCKILVSSERNKKYQFQDIDPEDILVATEITDFTYVNIEDINLFVDEFLFYTDKQKNNILQKKWKSLSIFSTLRV